MFRSRLKMASEETLGERAFAGASRSKPSEANPSVEPGELTAPGEDLARPSRLVPALIVAAVTLVLYAPILRLLVFQWWKDPNYGHGFFVPLFAAFVVWRQRKDLGQVPVQPAWSGLSVMLVGLGLLFLGSLGAEPFIGCISLLVLLAGTLAFVAGWKLLHALAFPLGYLLLMIPLPAIIQYQITFPLQLLSSRLAADCLELLHMPVVREGNLLILPDQVLEVVEACSGIRSLISLLALAVAVAYLREKSWLKRVALVVLTVPIAIVANGLRVLGTGAATYLIGPGAAHGFFHEFSGLVVFATAMTLFFVAHWLLGKVGRKGSQAHA